MFDLSKMDKLSGLMRKNKIDAVGGLVVNQAELKIEQNLSVGKEKRG